MKRQDRVDSKKLEKYFKITEKALKMAKDNVNSRRRKAGEEILMMASSYFEDAKYFRKKGEYVNAFACLNYAHGWLDTGSRLGIFDVTDSNIFVIK